MALLDATTDTRVKNRLGVGSSTSLDTVIGEMITSVSFQFEHFIGRPLNQESRTQTYNVRARTERIFLRSTPVASITSVKNRSSIATDFSGVTAMDSDNYDVDLDTGELFFNTSLYSGALMLQVVYTAGFATSTANLISAYPDIAEACDMQVVHMLKRRSEPGAEVQTNPAGSTTRRGDVALIKGVRQILSPYRMPTLGVSL